MSDYKSQFHMTDEITYLLAATNEQAGRISDERNKVPVARDEMSEDIFNHMMETGYQQAQADEAGKEQLTFISKLQITTA